MAISSGDIKFYYTNAADSSSSEDSLGGAVTANVVGASLHQLFDATSPEEATAGDIEYRAIDVRNTSVETLFDAVLWVSTETSGTEDTVAVAFDSAGTQGPVANENTAPDSPTLTFTTDLTKAAGISLGDIAASGNARVWFRWTIDASASAILTSGQITVEGGTGP